jgi:hypothetical protein
MRVTKVVLVLGLLLALELLAYGLSRGLFIGSDVVSHGYYHKHCRYLSFAGISVERSGGWEAYASAEGQPCRLFQH